MVDVFPRRHIFFHIHNSQRLQVEEFQFLSKMRIVEVVDRGPTRVTSAFLLVL